MRLSTVLSACQLVLMTTHVLDRALLRLGVRRAAAAITALAVLLSTGWEQQVLTNCAVYPEALLAVAVSAWMCRRRPVGRALLAAAIGGLAAWGMLSAWPNASEQGMLVGLPAAVAAMTLPNAREALLCAVLAPIVCGLATAMQDWYLFDMFYLRLGSAVQLDAILFAATALLLRQGFPAARRADGMPDHPVEAQQKA